MDLEASKRDFLTELNFINIVGSKIFLSPFVGKSNIKLLCFFFVYFLLLLTSLQLVFTLCLTGFSDWMEIINIAPNIGACVMSHIKYTVIYRNGKVYDKILRHFRDDLWELIPDHSKDNIQIFLKYKTVVKLLNRYIILVLVLIVVVEDSLPWCLMTYESKVLGKDLILLYPFDAWYPFDKIKWYSIIYIWESLMTAIVVYIYTMASMVHLFFVACICMELTLLGNWIQNLINENDIYNINKRQRVIETHDEIKRKLKFIIKRHTFLNEISSELDDILGAVMLLSYCFGTVFICLTAFSFTVVDDTWKSIRYITFFLSILVEMFNQCIIGQVLIDHSVALTENIYSCNWTEADYETKQILLMMMLRVQTPFKLTAMKYIAMNLNTFSRICSTSYQFFNLLLTVYEP